MHVFDGQKIRHKTVDKVIQEIVSLNSARAMYKRQNAVFFADDNIIADKHFARDLFQALKPINVKWMCQASINISREDELLKLMRDSGCGAVFIGFESLSQDNLKSMNKGLNRKYSFREAIDNPLMAYNDFAYSV